MLTLKVLLIEGGVAGADDQIIASSDIPFDALPEAMDAYKRALAAVTLLSQFGALMKCTAVFHKHGVGAIRCTRDRGHEARKEKHAGADGSEW